MKQITNTIHDLFVVLTDAAGHLRRHCACSGTSHCVPCEVAAEAHTGLEQIRQWRAQGAALIDPLAHVARCVEAITSNFPECSPCAGLHEAGGAAQVTARSWEESHRG